MRIGAQLRSALGAVWQKLPYIVVLLLLWLVWGALGGSDVACVLLSSGGVLAAVVGSWPNTKQEGYRRKRSIAFAGACFALGFIWAQYENQQSQKEAQQRERLEQRDGHQEQLAQRDRNHAELKGQYTI